MANATVSSSQTSRRWLVSLRNEKRCRALALDYALACSLVALFPIQGYYSFRLAPVLLLLGKMLWDMGRIWQFSRGQDWLAIAGNLFGVIGALAASFSIWLLILAAGIWIPYVGSFKGMAGLFVLTWSLGQSTNQYYTNGYRLKLLREYQRGKV